MPHVGEAFAKQYVFSHSGIADFASRCEDGNPLHFDERFAANSRFGGIIASGPHASAVHMALLATHFAPRHDVVGLEFSVRFVKAIPANTTATMSWLVVDMQHSPKLDGDVLSLEGKIEDAGGVTYIVDHARIAVWPKRNAADKA